LGVVILRRWPACAPTAYEVRDCRKFEKHCYRCRADRDGAAVTFHVSRPIRDIRGSSLPPVTVSSGRQFSWPNLLYAGIFQDTTLKQALRQILAYSFFAFVSHCTPRMYASL
jgi:hypothetical protein